jgi:hypothetical protein
MADYSFWTFIFEVVVFATTLPFVFLTFASGYLGFLWRAAKKNRWGLLLLKKKESGADTWEREIGVQ